MPVVRYVVLAALVVWLGGTVQALAGARIGSNATMAYVCGGIIVVGLVVMKFVGPPPGSFAVRVAIAALMLAITAAAAIRGQPDHSTTTLAATACLGAILLAWYARE
jgi:hypothetical protein